MVWEGSHFGVLLTSFWGIFLGVLLFAPLCPGVHLISFVIQVLKDRYSFDYIFIFFSTINYSLIIIFPKMMK
jgi:hypothetical protein